MEKLILLVLISAVYADSEYTVSPLYSNLVSSADHYPMIYDQVYAPEFLGGAVHSQYHEQDTLGRFRFGYETPESRHHEIGEIDGSRLGTYSYYDSYGILQTANYRADDTGFHVAATNLPVAPKAEPALFIADEPAVAKVKTHHLALAEAYKNGDEEYIKSLLASFPQPVADELTFPQIKVEVDAEQHALQKLAQQREEILRKSVLPLIDRKVLPYYNRYRPQQQSYAAHFNRPYALSPFYYDQPLYDFREAGEIEPIIRPGIVAPLYGRQFF